MMDISTPRVVTVPRNGFRVLKCGWAGLETLDKLLKVRYRCSSSFLTYGTLTCRNVQENTKQINCNATFLSASQIYLFLQLAYNKTTDPWKKIVQ